MQCEKKRSCTSQWLTVSLLLVVIIPATSKGYAKGPSPKTDFAIKTQDEGFWVPETFEATGALSTAGTVGITEAWIDDDGTEWARYRFATDDSNYFETVLPRWPEKGVKYDFILAAPDGFHTWNGSDPVVYEGDWAYGTATARTQRKSYIWEAWGGGYEKYYYDAVEWRLDGLLVP